MKRFHFLLLILMLIGSLALSACNLIGFGGFSPNSERVAFIKAVDDGGGIANLFTSDVDGSNRATIAEKSVLSTFNISYSAEGNRVAYIAMHDSCLGDTNFDGCPRLMCLSTIDGTGQDCFETQLGDATFGALTFLPNNDILVFFLASENLFNLHVYNRFGGLIRTEDAFNQYFLSAGVIETKRNTNGLVWTMNPYDENGKFVPFSWIVTRGDEILRFRATESGVEGPTLVTARASGQLATILTERIFLDLDSGVLSPDGTKLIIRTGNPIDNGDPQVFDLYLIDLESNNNNIVTLVNDADFRVEYAFSPTGGEIAYSSPADGGSVWILDVESRESRKLADGASLPRWD